MRVLRSRKSMPFAVTTTVPTSGASPSADIVARHFERRMEGYMDLSMRATLTELSDGVLSRIGHVNPKILAARSTAQLVSCEGTFVKVLVQGRLSNQHEARRGLKWNPCRHSCSANLAHTSHTSHTSTKLLAQASRANKKALLRRALCSLPWRTRASVTRPCLCVCVCTALGRSLGVSELGRQCQRKSVLLAPRLLRVERHGM